jgi:hypothetical protein
MTPPVWNNRRCAARLQQFRIHQIHELPHPDLREIPHVIRTFPKFPGMKALPFRHA